MGETDFLLGSVEKDANFKVPWTVIREIKPHPKPGVERLEIAVVYDWEVIVGKGNHKVGDKVFYIPANSLLPQWLENYIFPPDSKIKLEKHRVKAIRIQGFVSQGMIVNMNDVCNAARNITKSDINWMENNFILEKDYQDLLGIKKYIPPNLLPKEARISKQGVKAPRPSNENLNFHRYGGLENIKWYPDLFTPGENVCITEKIHGTNFRAGWLPYTPRTRWAKFKNWIAGWFGKKKEWEFVYGSNNVQLQGREYGDKNFYKSNYYYEAVVKYDLKNKLGKGQVVYGEIYGNDIQKGYDYGLKNERRIALFDYRFHDNGESTWMSQWALEYLANTKGLPLVPKLYEGPFSKEKVQELIGGPSVLYPGQKIREGVVVKNVLDYSENRKALKCINPDYTMKEASGETSDFQ